MFEGKTTFLFYLLVQLLQRGQVVLFSRNGVELFLFYYHKVYRTTVTMLDSLESTLRLPHRKLSSSNTFIWSLFDVKKPTEPEELLVQRPCLPVQTAPSDPSRYKQWEKHQVPLLTGLALWTRVELTQGYTVLISYFYPHLSTYQAKISRKVSLTAGGAW